MGNCPIIDTTRSRSHPSCSKNQNVQNVVVIGSIRGVLNAVNSLENSKNCICSAAVIEDYKGKTFWSYFFRAGAVKKLKMLLRIAKSYRSAKAVNKKLLNKVPAVFYSPTETISELFEFIPLSVFESADMFLLACDDMPNTCKISDYAAAIMSKGGSREKIFIAPQVMHIAELPVFQDGELSPLCKNISDVKPVMRYMEYHVTDFCNLKCKGCGHLANHVKTLEFAGADTFRLSLERLREKFENIEVLRIMGGEPLLCRELHEYINAAHEVFPYSQIKIVTNALLYKNITNLTVEAIKNAGAEIYVSQYPPTREIVPEFAEFCRERGIKLYVSRPVTQFFMRFVSGHDADFRQIWYTCESRYCHFLHGTNFYACPAVWTYTEPKFREIIGDKFFTESECRGYVYDLLQDIDADGWDILAKIENPMKLCLRCGDTKTLFTWESECSKN